MTGKATGRSRWVIVEVRNAETVCCEQNLLAAGLLRMGVELHPQAPFRIEHHEVDGKEVRVWRWLFATATKDGRFKTGDLVGWWRDDKWLAGNPRHEWALIRETLGCMFDVAKAVRESVPRVVVKRGRCKAYIPTNASPARRAFLIAKLEGKIPLNEDFVEPALVTS